MMKKHLPNTNTYIHSLKQNLFLTQQCMTMSSSVYACSILFIWFLSKISNFTYFMDISVSFFSVLNIKLLLICSSSIIVSTLSSGQVNCRAVWQSPPQIVQENTTVNIFCSHSDSSRPVMLWYQQIRDIHSMTLIGFGYGTGPQTYEGTFKEEFELKRDSSLKGTLIIHSANLSHSAVYFCAASAQ